MDTTPPKTDAEPKLSPAALRSLVDEAPDGIFVADVQGAYTYVNKAGLKLLGYTREELLAKKIEDLIPSEDRPRLEGVRQALMQGATDTAQWRLKRADGSFVTVEVTANIVAGGQWHGFVRDVSARMSEQAEREALAERLRSDRRELQVLFDTLPVGVILFGADGAIRWNRRAEEVLGIKLQAGVGARQYASMVFSADGVPVAPEELPSSRVMRGETVVGQEFQVRRPDGAVRPVLASAAPVRDGAGKCVGAVGVFVDTTERMQLESAIRKSERLLKSVIELLPVGLWITDATGAIVTANPAAERIWSAARGHWPAQPSQYHGWRVDSGKPIAPDDWVLARALRDRRTCAGEVVRIQCLDGISKTLINSAAPMVSDDGQLVGAIVVHEDITALYEAQQKLASSEQLFRTVFDLLPVGLWISDAEGRIVGANAAGQQIWQGARYVKPEDFGEYRAWWADTGEAIAPEDWGVARAIRRGETSRRELIRIQCFDHSYKTVINWAAPIRTDTGEITGAVAVNEDVTALHQTQEQLRAAVRDREQILAVVSHDLRNPLAAILAAASTIDLKAAALREGAAIQDLAVTLKDVARQMSGMVNDLLAAAVNGSGRSVLNIAPVSASFLVERAARAARPLFARARISFRVEVEPDLPLLHLDADRIARVFGNLLDNARKFTNAGGEVVLRAQPQASGVRFSVMNTGTALTKEEMDQMFQAFWQSGRGDSRGAGLGLSICRSIVEAHGGTIWAEPAAGYRVRVCFLVPAAPQTRIVQSSV